MKQVFTFELQRKSGNKGIKGGNQMISTNDRMHPMVKSQISRYLRELAKDVVLSKGMTEHIPLTNLVMLHWSSIHQQNEEWTLIIGRLH